MHAYPAVEELPKSTGVVVALGKFDAMHLGHRALAIKVSDSCHMAGSTANKLP